MTLLLSWLISAVAVWVAASILPGIRVRSFGSAFWVAALIGVANALLGWVFFTLFAVLTLGVSVLLAFLTRWIISAIMIQLVGAMSDALEVDGFKSALFAAAIMSLVSTVGSALLLR